MFSIKDTILPPMGESSLDKLKFQHRLLPSTSYHFAFYQFSASETVEEKIILGKSKIFTSCAPTALEAWGVPVKKLHEGTYHEYEVASLLRVNNNNLFEQRMVQEWTFFNGKTLKEVLEIFSKNEDYFILTEDHAMSFVQGILYDTNYPKSLHKEVKFVFSRTTLESLKEKEMNKSGYASTPKKVSTPKIQKTKGWFIRWLKEITRKE